jgi:hypothetical protein
MGVRIVHASKVMVPAMKPGKGMGMHFCLQMCLDIYKIYLDTIDVKFLFAEWGKIIPARKIRGTSPETSHECKDVTRRYKNQQHIYRFFPDAP